MSETASPVGADHELLIDGVAHEFDTRTGPVAALSPINLTIESGEFLTIAGPSGCGKTTLLRVIAGLLQPTQGQVITAGRPVTAPAPERGFVFQQPTLYPWFDVRANVALGLRIAGADKATQREVADQYLDLVGLSDVAELRPYELSGGMQQRVQIARVLANDPDIVLMDEPFGALDALTRERLQNELLTIWRSTVKTIIFITHSVDEAVFLGSRVMVMSPRPGRIVFDDSARFADESGKVPPERIRALPEFSELTSRVRSAISH